MMLLPLYIHNVMHEAAAKNIHCVMHDTAAKEYCYAWCGYHYIFIMLCMKLLPKIFILLCMILLPKNIVMHDAATNRYS